MVWIKDFENENNTVWVDSQSQRFIHLKRFTDGHQWIVRIGIKSSASNNQEALYKNKSRAMGTVKNLFVTKKWGIN